jgi:hypothetical protein
MMEQNYLGLLTFNILITMRQYIGDDDILLLAQHTLKLPFNVPRFKVLHLNFNDP